MLKPAKRASTHFLLFYHARGWDISTSLPLPIPSPDLQFLAQHLFNLLCFIRLNPFRLPQAVHLQARPCNLCLLVGPPVVVDWTFPLCHRFIHVGNHRLLTSVATMGCDLEASRMWAREILDLELEVQAAFVVVVVLT